MADTRKSNTLSTSPHNIMSVHTPTTKTGKTKIKIGSSKHLKGIHYPLLKRTRQERKDLIMNFTCYAIYQIRIVGANIHKSCGYMLAP